MPYKKMRLEYFKLLESLLATNVYIKIYLNTSMVPVIEVIEINENGETLVMNSNLSNSNSKNLLDLIHEMSTRLNGGEPVFPQYAKTKMRRKTLDNVIALDYQLYFYKMIDGQILATVSKEYEAQNVYDIFITTRLTMKEAFETLDAEIYNNFGFWPGIKAKNGDDFREYTAKLVRKRRELERDLTAYSC